MEPTDSLRESFYKKSLSLFAFPPSEGQVRLFYAFSRFIFSEKDRCVLLLRGYAGTGKTTSVSVMVNALTQAGVHCILLAPTGRAAKVLSGYSGLPAETIHRRIYVRNLDGSGGFRFVLAENIFRNAIFFVDEASMIVGEKEVSTRNDPGSGNLLDDLMTYVFSGNNCRLVLVGDSAQLPPVGSERSPALEIEFLRVEYHLNAAEIELTEVIRQKADSGILHNATAVRSLITAQSGEYPVLSATGFTDVKVLNAELQEAMEQEIREYGIDGVVMITRSNKRSNLFNQQIRLGILGHEEEINQGDRMMVLKNNYFWLNDQPGTHAGFIANGDTIRIVRIRRFEERGSFRFCHATIAMIDYNDVPEFDVVLWCDSIWEEASSLSFEKTRELFAEVAKDYEDELSPAAVRKAVLKDPIYNALQVKFAYAITCHKAQGGQWPCVFVDKGYVTEEMHGLEMNRWLYTAITRASEKLYLVGFEDGEST